MIDIAGLIQKRADKGELVSLTLVKVPPGRGYQAALDYGMGSFAVHCDDDPLKALAYVLETEFHMRRDILQAQRNDFQGVYVADQQVCCGHPVNKTRTHITQECATMRIEPIVMDLDELLS